ncbi:MAG: hypothetical protein WC895_02190 [Candidatus Shapirobacteria bacterium]
MWWKIDKKDIDEEINEYSKNKKTSFRKVAGYLILASLLLTCVFVFFGLIPSENLFSIIIYLPLAILVMKGYRPFIVIAMIFITIDRFGSIALMGQYSVSSVGLRILWWAFQMRFLFGAFLVEKKRTRSNPSNTIINNSNELHFNKNQNKNSIIKYLIIAILAIILVVALFIVYKKYSSDSKVKQSDLKQNNVTNIVDQEIPWKEYFLVKDKYKISFPSDYVSKDWSIKIDNMNINFTEFTGSEIINNSVKYYRIDYLDLAQLSQKYKEEYNSEEADSYSKTFLKGMLDETTLNYKILDNSYKAFFDRVSETRELEKIKDTFWSYPAYHFTWKNSDINTFVKGKIVLVNSKDLYVISCISLNDDFGNFDKFANSWKPFGDISE